MEMTVNKNGTELTMKLSGRLDTLAAPSMTEKLDELLVDGVSQFVLDMGDCDYVASSGLRAIISAQKKMTPLQGAMIVKNVIGDVMEVFDMTGFSDILTFE